ncbi:hypothetical protein [Streptomyces capitiformicae]|uniref:Secreted protein n=1 Tax=Streptomyces capitiformicae TaxID=2014920 RepID=A0A918Z9F4_9ACTN|nr:hypothetical protein [Streptomyces capitiformicae]GHE39421.1 hypothetical protein GCM10017771_58190 [Streptomyces capitiformicae]
MSRVRRVLTATAMATALTATVAGGTAAAAEIGTMGQGDKCTYKEQSMPLKVSHKGAGDKKYNNGVTEKYGRVLILSTGKWPDYSAARLSGKVRKADRVWVDISYDKGKNWQGCGGVSTDKKDKKFYSKWYRHSGDGVKGRVMRACARTTMGATDNGKRVTWCATVGDVKSKAGARWWSDN